MKNSEAKTVSLLTYSDTVASPAVDAYGQIKKGSYTTSSIEMYVKVYSQANVQDPRYVDCEVIGLTKADVTTKNSILIDSIKYEVLYVVPTRRMNEVFLRKAA